MLLVDADNAFNALQNVQHTCPPLATIAINFYRTSSRLFVTGVSSEEGTTQGCPLSMALYAVSVIPLINKCRDTATMDCNPATQVWYADDAAAGGSLKALHRFWNLLTQHGPTYGYFPKSSKSFLVTKPGHRGDAEHIFSSTGIQFTDNGQDLKHKATIWVPQWALRNMLQPTWIRKSPLGPNKSSSSPMLPAPNHTQPMPLLLLDYDIAGLSYSAPCQQPAITCSR